VQPDPLSNVRWNAYLSESLQNTSALCSCGAFNVDTIQANIIRYLGRLDPSRRAYAEAYLEWRNSAAHREQPVPTGLGINTSWAMRKRLDAMLIGQSAFTPATPIPPQPGEVQSS
jgi:hypothetical protein